MNDESVVRFDSVEAREILRRALAMEHRMEGSLTLAELADAAREVGISPESIASAAKEYHECAQRDGLNHSTLRYSIALAVAGLLTGAYATSIERLYYLPFSVSYSLMFVMSGGIAFTAHKAGRFKTFGRFQIKNMTLYLGSLLGMFAGGMLSDMIRGLTTTRNSSWILFQFWLAMWAGSSLVGGAVAFWRGNVTQSPSDGLSSTLPFQTRIKRVLRVRLKQMVDRIFAEYQRIRLMRVAIGKGRPAIL